MIVSVLMITYNHEKYIREAIEGVLMQKTNFDLELIIGEDCSTDNTRNICIEYEKKHPDIIKLHANKNNMGMMPNFIQTLNACTAKYIAMCEGDDYWTDPRKLQKQVDFLEANEDCSMCFTNREEISNSGKLLHRSKYENKTYTTGDIINGFIPATQTIVFRNVPGLQAYLNKHSSLPSGDRLLTYFCSLFGSVELLPSFTAVYRHSGEGVWSRFKKSEQFFLSMERFIEFHKVISLPVNNEYTHKRVNGAFFFFLKTEPKFLIKNMRKVRFIKKKYGIRSRFFLYVFSKLFSVFNRNHS